MRTLDLLVGYTTVQLQITANAKILPSVDLELNFDLSFVKRRSTNTTLPNKNKNKNGSKKVYVIWSCLGHQSLYVS
jgi:hypothetical protein